jgi:oxalate decarboxylase/phosphoglucose isomerase-like protein (cupin superfamily)
MATDQYTNYRDRFIERGVIGPIQFLTREQATLLGRHLLTLPRGRPVWDKSLATIDSLTYETGSNPGLIRLLRELLGEDIILWGAELVVRKPGQIHYWHCDIEACAPEGGFVSVWIGLLNTQQESSPTFIPGSHTYGVTIQELAAREGLARHDRTDDVVLRLANMQRQGAEIAQPAVADGEAVLFDGRMWHGSRNALSERPRAALLLQYARADISVKVPDFRDFEWPFHYKEDVRPPVIPVSSRNAIVKPPTIGQQTALRPSVHPIDPNERCKDGVNFTPTHCFMGRTDNVDYLESHYSVLMPGHSPHLPHAHLDEEILVVMSGAAELVVATSPRDENPRILPAPAGSAIYYPPYQHHTIRNVSSEPVRYAMLRWKSLCISAGKHLPCRFVAPVWLEGGGFRGPVAMRLMFEGPSAFLGKLHAHVTRVLPGAGYRAHRDDHDVSIFLIEGEIEIVGKAVAAPALVFLPAGCLHGMKALGGKAAKYVVWEFHRTYVPHLSQAQGHAAQVPDAVGLH